MSVLHADDLEACRTDVLDAATGQTPAAALETLDAALRWTVEVLRRMPIAPDDLDGTAFRLVEPLTTHTFKVFVPATRALAGIV